MSIDQIASEALLLPARERALLAGSLWESLEDPDKTNAQMDEATTLALAIERDQQLESGQVRALSHEEVMGKLRR
jgi:hypothetical protein